MIYNESLIIIDIMEKEINEEINEKEAERLQEKMKKNAFDLDDFLSQLQQMKKMGGGKMQKMMAKMQQAQEGGHAPSGMPDLSKMKLPGMGGGNKFPF